MPEELSASLLMLVGNLVGLGTTYGLQYVEDVLDRTVLKDELHRRNTIARTVRKWRCKRTTPLNSPAWCGHAPLRSLVLGQAFWFACSLTETTPTVP